MTQKEKELLLKDLCARLPYGVKVLCLRDFNHDWYNLEMVDIGDNEVYVTTYEPYANRYVKIEEVKPYLFPLESMSEEQRKEYEDALVYHDYVNGGWTMAKTFDDEYVVPYWFVDFCNKHHFDYRGLIPMGLAIDATGLNIY